MPYVPYYSGLLFLSRLAIIRGNMDINLETLGEWSKPKEVATKFGPRILRRMAANESFWALWRTHKIELKAMGISVSKDLQHPDKFIVCWWGQLDAAELAKRQANERASRAATTDFSPPAPDGLNYFPFQRAGIQFALDKEGVYIGDEMGLGKALADDTCVITPSGYVFISHLKPGDEVIGSNGLPTKVLGVYPQGLKPCSEVTFSDGAQVIASDDHLWTVRDFNGKYRHRPWQVKTTRCIARDSKQFEIPLVSPVSFKRAHKPYADPYLIGVLLGNGSLTGCPQISTRHPEQLDLIRPLLPPGVFIRNPPPTDPLRYGLTTGIRGMENLLTSLLKLDGVWGHTDENKNLPEGYYRWTPLERLALLQGLLDSDGTCKDARVRFTSCSKGLVYGVRMLVLSLGGLAAVGSETKPSERGKKSCWTVTITAPNLRLFRLNYHLKRLRQPRKAIRRTFKSIVPVGLRSCTCIKVAAPDELFCVEDYILTHNTIQGIGIINTDPSISKVLVITKASLKDNWRRELLKWLVRPLAVGIAEGQRWPRDCDIVIINYDILGKHFNSTHGILWDLIICDESANFKNRKSQRAKNIIGYYPSAKKINEGEKEIPRLQAKRRVCLSGTPIENRIEELWPALNFLDHARWNNFWSYSKRYCGAISNGFGYDTKGASHVEELQKILRETLMIRRMKKDVLTELPAKIRLVHEMDTAGLEAFIRQEQSCWKEHEDVLEEAQAQVELAKASDDAEAYKQAVKNLKGAKFAFAEIARVRHDTAVAKVPQLIELIKEDLEETEKILIFGHHKDVLKPIAEAFNAVMITGETPATDRQGICDRFQTDPRARVFVGSIRACGEGLTLTAATLVIFVEEDWTTGKVSQAEDRAHRIGQQDVVTVKHYVVPGTIDAKMLKTTLEKQEIIDKALDIESQWEAHQPAFVPSPALGKKKEIEEEACLLTTAQVEAIHQALRGLSMVCDGAFAIDGMGFNKIDSRIGKDLASRAFLTPKQAALGKRLCMKYTRQISDDLFSAING